MTSYNRAIKRERDRNRKWRKTAQGAFESSMFHIDAYNEPVELSYKYESWLSDLEIGAKKIRSFDEGLSQWDADVSYGVKALLHYRRRFNTAYVRLKRSKPHLLRTFVLICQYGENRNASISILQEKTKDWDAAHRLYFFHREKILNFFRIQ